MATLPFGKTIIVSSIYLPPSQDKLLFLEELSSVLQDTILDGNEIILLGDFNINWMNSSPVRDKFLNLTNINNMTQLTQLFTYVSPSTGNESLLDLCFASNTLSVTSAKTLVTDMADHYAISVSFAIKKTRHSKILIECRNFKKGLDTLPAEAHQNFDLIHKIRLTPCPNNQAQILEDWMLEKIQRHAPLKKLRIRPEHKKWLSVELKFLITKKSKLFRIATKASRDMRSEALIRYKKCRNFVQSKVKTAKRKYYSNNISSDKQSFYKEINTLLDKKTSTPQI